MLRRRALGLLAGLAFGLAACSTGNGGTATTPTPTSAAYPVTVGSVTLDKQPTKIVSLGPTATEMLFAVNAGTQVVAVDDQSNYPAGVPKTDLSAFKPSAEAIAAKNPDLVVLTNDSDKIVDQLKALKIPTFLVPAATTLDEAYAEITDLGKLTGHADDAAKVVTDMKSKLDTIVKSIKQRAKPLTYFYEVSPDLYSATSKTFIGSIFTLLGLQNVADAADADGKAFGYPQLSAEALVKANPDMIFLADAKCCQQTADTVKARAGWAGITAVSKGQIVALDDDIASRWGPRIVDLAQTVATAVNQIP
ncbi:MAG: ABC transporter substrate-binding protein [Hamadaea sp.]|uniref:ABC transporter substrate-binding protein n=1 Tax=Hamadaea sp. TaxID=2024425 RepID=UPI001812706A|nr:ABC transporter substrate-binding protein [Hamadaea sp.]NUR72042.1 ABC transporter substrate-binding protein [Hamadaea sp.]NUT17592.1 ABC transporter substrate-binding protein [Hamadaea sp.]